LEGVTSKDERSARWRLLLSVSIILIFLSLITGIIGYYRISVIIVAVNTAIFIYLSSSLRKTVKIDVIRWQLWFCLECAAGFFFFTNLVKPPADSIIPSIPNLALYWNYSLFVRIYDLVWLLSPFFILFRQLILAPIRFEEYAKKHGIKEKLPKIKQELGRIEISVFLLCCILGLGFGIHLLFLLLGSTLYLIYRRLVDEIRHRRLKETVTTFFGEYGVHSISFWNNFSKTPYNVTRAFFAISLVYFLNLPAIDFLLIQDLVIFVLSTLAIGIIAATIYYQWPFQRSAKYIAVILIFVIGSAILSGNPSSFAFIKQRAALGMPQSIQYLMLLLFLWLLTLALLLLSSKHQIQNKSNVISKGRPQRIIKIFLYSSFTLVYALIIIWIIESISVGQIRVALLFGFALLLAFPLARKI